MDLEIKTIEELTQLLFLVFLGMIAIVLLGVVINVFITAKAILNKKLGIETEAFSLGNWWSKNVTGLVSKEKEKTIVLNHDYDGIRELDNHLPPWWIGMFYACIVFAVVYMLNYHVWHWSPSQTEEYEIAMTEAADAKALKAASDPESQIDETAITMLMDEADIERGKLIYDGNCAICHGRAGEGGVGPNLTDAYWLHGGSTQEVYDIIKQGVPEKGMISWANTLKPLDIQQVSSFIKTMEGTEPANPKDPQGDLYVAE